MAVAERIEPSVEALGDLRWPDLDRPEPDSPERDSPDLGSGARSLLVVPLGATEQHGPHLPLSTDTDLAVALARELAARRGDAVVAPALPYGSSGEHQAFPGTLSIGRAALELLAVELCRSATAHFAHVLLVSGHGGNHDAARAAVDTLRSEARDVRLWSPSWRGDPHAGRTETSLMLWLAPLRVRPELAQAGNTTPLTQLMAGLRGGRLRELAPNGVLGDPTGASAEEGRQAFQDLVNDLAADVGVWRGSAP